MNARALARFGPAVVAGAIAITTALVVKWEPPPGDMRLVAIRPVPGDPWTICDGHTRGVYEGMRATPEQCERWRNEDIDDAMGVVARCINAPLTAGQLGAFTDGVFNLGPQLVCGSTLQRKANGGDLAGACAELRRWIYAHGKVYTGLVRRRSDEQSICEGRT